jgi:hypothetical protein
MPSTGVIVADEALGREIKQFREDTSKSFQRLEAGLDKLLPREVYEARHDALKRRVDALEREAERAEAERVAARRWVVACVVLPLVTMAVTIILNVTGP